MQLFTDEIHKFYDFTPVGWKGTKFFIQYEWDVNNWFSEK